MVIQKVQGVSKGESNAALRKMKCGKAVGDVWVFLTRMFKKTNLETEREARGM